MSEDYGETACKILKTYVSEFGIENVTISLPERWKKHVVEDVDRYLNFSYKGDLIEIRSNTGAIFAVKP